MQENSVYKYYMQHFTLIEHLFFPLIIFLSCYFLVTTCNCNGMCFYIHYIHIQECTDWSQLVPIKMFARKLRVCNKNLKIALQFPNNETSKFMISFNVIFYNIYSLTIYSLIDVMMDM